MGESNNTKIGKVVRVPLREIWTHEARDFTRWLAENLEYIEECTGISLSLVETEAATGDFAADILAEGDTGNLVIIENQIERTNHDHLGKLITYMSNHEAKVAIWITSRPRPEHEKAVHWLNEVLPAGTAFYLIQVEVIRINDSNPAPLFTVVARPSSESRRIREELSKRHILRLEFWKQLLEKIGHRSSLFANISPSKANWIATGAGRTGLSWSFVILMDHARVELYINAQEAERNKEIFDFLVQQKEPIEESFGTLLDWQRMEGKRASRICYYIRDHGGLRDSEQWGDLQEAMSDAMIRLEKAFRPHLKNLP